LTDVDQTVFQELSAKAAAAMRARHPK